MNNEAQERLRKGFEEASNKLKNVKDFIEDLARVEQDDNFDLQEWVERARLLCAVVPATDGDARMLAWNNEWRPARVPEWFKKACRHYLVARGLWCTYHDPLQLMLATQNDYRVLFNRVGSIDKGPMRPVVLQPYGTYDATAKEFAEILRVKLEIIRPGIWHPDTTTYVFRYGV